MIVRYSVYFFKFNLSTVYVLNELFQRFIPIKYNKNILPMLYIVYAQHTNMK